ncbi:MAG: hypothetical protein AAF752_09165 [Bacteroidota bacterium]
MTKPATPKHELPKAGDTYQATPQGSLGLLALGAVGLRLWRQARAEAEAAAQEDKPSPASDASTE